MNILNFNYNNKNYEIRKEENKLNYLVNNEVARLEDKKIFYLILRQLVPRSNPSYINTIKYKGQEYKIYKDRDKNIYSFSPFNKEFLEKFNIMFNNQNEYVASGFTNSDKFKRIVKIGKKIVLAVFGVGVVLTSQSSQELHEEYQVEDIPDEIVSIKDVIQDLEDELVRENISIEKLQELDIEDISSINPQEEVETIESLDTTTNVSYTDDIVIPKNIGENYLDEALVTENDNNNIPKTVGEEYLTGDLRPGEFVSIDDNGAGVYVEEDTASIPKNIGEDFIDEALVIESDNNNIPQNVGEESLTGDLRPGEFISIDDNGAGVYIEQDIRKSLEDALAQNNKLTDEEKEWFLKMEYEIKDNIELIDFNEYLRLISTVPIYYEPVSTDSLGTYNYVDNILTFFGATNISEVKSSTITHELGHMLQFTHEDKMSGGIFIEGTNATLNDEYFLTEDGKKYDSSYEHYSNYLKALMEIIGSEPIKKFNCTGNLNFLKDSLYSIIPNQDKANYLLDRIEYYWVCDKYGVPATDETEINIYEYLSGIHEDIVLEIKDYYEAKYQIPMESDLVMQIYLNRVSGDFIHSNLQMNSVPVEELSDIYTHLNKYYFNPNKINEPYTYYNIRFDENGIYGQYGIITEENRYLPLEVVQDYNDDMNITR